jgi:hypothetical protein
MDNISSRLDITRREWIKMRPNLSILKTLANYPES